MSVPGGIDRLARALIEVDLLDEIDDLVWVSGPSKITTGGGACTEEQAEILESAGLNVDARTVPTPFASRFAGGVGAYSQVPVDMVERDRPEVAYRLRGYPFGVGKMMTVTRRVEMAAGNGLPAYVREVTEAAGESPTSIPKLLDRSVVDVLKIVDREFAARAIVTEATDDEIRRHLKIGSRRAPSAAGSDSVRGQEHVGDEREARRECERAEADHRPQRPHRGPRERRRVPIVRTRASVLRATSSTRASGRRTSTTRAIGFGAGASGTSTTSVSSVGGRFTSASPASPSP